MPAPIAGSAALAASPVPRCPSARPSSPAVARRGSVEVGLDGLPAVADDDHDLAAAGLERRAPGSARAAARGAVEDLRQAAFHGLPGGEDRAVVRAVARRTRTRRSARGLGHGGRRTPRAWRFAVDLTPLAQRVKLGAVSVADFASTPGVRRGTVPERSARASRRLTGRLSAAPSRAALLLLSSITLGAASCAEEFDTTRQVPTRGSVGEEMFGVLCDRVGAQALREDLTGASYRQVCHRPGPGKAFADRVDTTKLPTLDAAAVDEKGKPVPLDRQKESRRHAIARIEAMGRRRADVVRALDATFPEEMVATRDLGASNPKKSCEPGSGRSEEKLTIELADMLGRMGPLYNDGTLPESTRSLGRVVSSFRADPGAQAAWRKLSARRLPPARDRARRHASRDGVPAPARPLERDAPAPVARFAPLRAFAQVRRARPARARTRHRQPPVRQAPRGRPRGAPRGDARRDAPRAHVHARPIRRAHGLEPRARRSGREAVVFTTNDASYGSPNFIVRRDRRGYAAITGGLVPRLRRRQRRRPAGRRRGRPLRHRRRLAAAGAVLHVSARVPPRAAGRACSGRISSTATSTRAGPSLPRCSRTCGRS